MQVAQGFVQHYYTQFGQDRRQLGALYGPNSMLTFEDKQVMGGPAIVETLAALPFQTVRHVPKSVDAQPTVGNGVVVFVSGDLFVDGETNPVKFSQVFNLQPNEGGSFFVLNDLMRLNIG
eukprot:TRINITY_DN351_c0_g1_i3.p1 TRINITY_DN351_c0_g1~~TRINITY_DN351_c0_g1_i3.p1  ORF type:complete len:120 (-),score=37.97 TRINITY_DN351_c0_g1_i3:48-407(-)